MRVLVTSPRIRRIRRRNPATQRTVCLAAHAVVGHPVLVSKLLIGMLKGLVIGGALGWGAFALGLDGGFNWLTYGLVGMFVGLLVGRPLWSLILDKESTFLIGMLKALFGFGVGCGLYAIVAKAWGGFDLEISGQTHNITNWQMILGGAIGAVYGGFVELDDAVDDKARAAAKAAKTHARVTKKPRELPE